MYGLLSIYFTVNSLKHGTRGISSEIRPVVSGIVMNLYTKYNTNMTECVVDNTITSTPVPF